MDCHNCSYIINSRGVKNSIKVPIIKNIHKKIYDATSNDGALNMEDWHTCDTTHCRAGWVVHLAGKEGYELERKIGTALAANKIYKESSEINVKWALRFFEDNELAMEDIKRCAESEKKIDKIDGN